MLEDVERRIAELEAVFRTVATQPTTPPPRECLVEGHLPNLGATMETDIPVPRELLARGSGTIELQNRVRCNTSSSLRCGALWVGVLGVSDETLCANDGAGRGIQASSDANWVPRVDPGRRIIAQATRRPVS
jgi:hypothetical protein